MGRFSRWLQAPRVVALREWVRKYLRERQVVLIIGGLIGTFLVLFFAPDIFVTVKAGEAGVLWRRFFGGTVRDKVYGEGLHVIWPWDKLYIYNVRVQQIHRMVYVLDKTGLQYTLNVSIRYHPEYDMLALLHQKVGPEYAQKVVIPEVEGVLRTTAASLDAYGLFTGNQAVLAKIVNQSLADVDEKYIIIDNVIIQNIELPPALELAIEKKREQEQLAEAYVYRLQREQEEAKRKVIAAKGAAAANEILSASLNANILKWEGIQATMALASSTNSKMVVVGNGEQGLPIIFGAAK